MLLGGAVLNYFFSTLNLEVVDLTCAVADDLSMFIADRDRKATVDFHVTCNPP